VQQDVQVLMSFVLMLKDACDVIVAIALSNPRDRPCAPVNAIGVIPIARM